VREHRPRLKNLSLAGRKSSNENKGEGYLLHLTKGKKAKVRRSASKGGDAQTSLNSLELSKERE